MVLLGGTETAIAVCKQHSKDSPMIHTLPQALLLQAGTRGPAIALRYKRLGIWHPRSWSELAQDVSRLAAALHQRGFRRDDDLLIISQARAEALLLALAAQWLGGS